MKLDVSQLKLGDVFSLGRYQVADEAPWPIEWVIVHEANEGFYCMSKYILDLLAFDAAEPNNPNDDRKTNGNNNYGISNIYRWLNSEAPAGQWYQPAHKYDNSPDALSVGGNTSYTNRPGFLYHWSDDEKGLLKKYSLTLAYDPIVNTWRSYTIDGKVMLPTCTQMCNINNEYKGDSIKEGEHFTYFDSDAKRIAILHPEVLLNSSANKKPVNKSDGFMYRLASANCYNLKYTHCVDAIGKSSGSTPSYGCVGVRPIILIPKDAPIIQTCPFIIPSETQTIEAHSKILDVEAPGVVLKASLLGDFDGATSVKVYACNNAYDDEPTWENITTAWKNDEKIALTNGTKTAEKWGVRLWIVIDKANAPSVHLKGCAFRVIV